MAALAALAVAAAAAAARASSQFDDFLEQALKGETRPDDIEREDQRTSWKVFFLLKDGLMFCTFWSSYTKKMITFHFWSKLLEVKRHEVTFGCGAI